ncbi:hypothetical protein [Streptomyces nitrosporeus]|uniref:hypothetical protein n=1 Tax=Streptomyces nitrosporeus TaxID=28894 RepID=UPI0039A35EEA
MTVPYSVDASEAWLPKWQMPDLPEGALRTLNRELHSLHRQAGFPSARELHKVADNAVSHTKIHHAFTKPVLPSWGVVEIVVEELAKRARPRLDPDAEVVRFKDLWHQAEDDAGTQTPRVGRSTTSRRPALPLEFRRLIDELAEIRVRDDLALTRLADNTDYSRMGWLDVFEGRAIPPRHAIVHLSRQYFTRDERLGQLWEASVESARKHGHRLELQGDLLQAERYYRMAADCGDRTAEELLIAMLKVSDPMEAAELQDRRDGIAEEDIRRRSERRKAGLDPDG